MLWLDFTVPLLGLEVQNIAKVSRVIINTYNRKGLDIIIILNQKSTFHCLDTLLTNILSGLWLIKSGS